MWRNVQLSFCFKIKKTFISSEYSFHHLCREVVIFGDEYFKQPNSLGLETLISEFVLKRAFRKFILFSLPFCGFELQLIEVKCVAKQ